jgi:hypothetical protein
MNVSSVRALTKALSALLIVPALALGATGCETSAYCFRDCGDGTGGGTDAGTGGSDAGSGAFNPGGDGGCGILGCGGEGGGGGTGGCTPTGAEVCDGLDNDCNQVIDDITGLDLGAPNTCGTCSTNCYNLLANCEPTTVTCAQNQPGSPGDCGCGQCALNPDGTTDYYDLDPAIPGCEYYCPAPAAADDTLCNAKDDDCDGLVDEDVDLCSDAQNCGKCGRNCVVLNGSGACVSGGQMPCSEANTQCEIAACDPGYYDLDGSFATGCEYQCTPTNGGVEICGDGLDNDCDGLIDGADNLSGDPQIGVVCFGDPNGLCATAAHAGVTSCVSNQVVCTGPNVLIENQIAETCNGVDDDCDGVIDDSPTDAGASCGQSAIFPCSLGTQQCQNGALVCVGAVNPTTEVCNGQDDDCDGTIDDSPSDTGGACNVPPAGCGGGGTCACAAGTLSCVGGVPVCQGSVVAQPGASDTCGVDANCDGSLTNQPNTQTDVANCGQCGNDCYAGAVQSIWSCQMGQCVFQGCQPGYYDNGGPGDAVAGDGICGYACTFISAQEQCNGQDDDCDGQIDEGVIAPQASQVCGTSAAATRPECVGAAQGGQVNIQCSGGAWQCTFPAGVCPGGCSANDEICDNLDNDCDSVVNENVANWNQPCASDDGLPFPGHGACRTTGNFVCSGNNATTCSAVKADCATLPGGCTELCDNVDNDCDGVVDETFNAKGTNATNFVRPGVTKLAANLWIYSYEASRPTATNVVPGIGNGFHTAAPVGNTLDRTKSCSVATKIPWFNVTPQEVEQTCIAAGGTICSLTTWQNACRVNGGGETNNCTYGFNPNGAACTSTATGSKFCNVGSTFDFDPGVAGNQDGLLPTASSSLQNCWADWSGLQGNVAATNKLFDVTGNVREIVSTGVANEYKLMGGAFNSQSESGSSCDFTFYTVNQTFKFFDTGFRCCFTADPTL